MSNYIASEYTIPLSPKAKEIQEHIRKNHLPQTPLKYNKSFLDAYQPNVSHYLSEESIEKLVHFGRTVGSDSPGAYFQCIYNLFAFDFIWNSSRLEGSTYTILEAERLLETKIAAERKPSFEKQIILNHQKALEFVKERANVIAIDAETLQHLHQILSDQLLDNLDTCSTSPDLIREAFAQTLETAQAIQNPFEQAFFLMVHIACLQPFKNVNNAVGRVAANVSLVRSNQCPMTFVDLPKKDYLEALIEIEKLNSTTLLQEVFLWGYERSFHLYSPYRKFRERPDPFHVHYAPFIFDVVVDVVRGRMDKTDAVKAIKQKALEEVPEEHRQKFIEVVEIELRSLHEYNFQSYKLSLDEFNTWLQVWN